MKMQTVTRIMCVIHVLLQISLVHVGL